MSTACAVRIGSGFSISIDHTEDLIFCFRADQYMKYIKIYCCRADQYMKKFAIDQHL